MPQWQYSVAKGEPETQYLMAPQRQPPSMFLMFIFFWSGQRLPLAVVFEMHLKKMSTVLNCYTAYLAKED